MGRRRRNCCCCGCLVLLAPLLLIIMLAMLLLKGEMGADSFNPGPDIDIETDLPLIQRELYDRKSTYIEAADAANEGLCGLAANYGLGWGVLAAIDFMASDDEFRAFELAGLLASEAEYSDGEVVVTVWRRRVVDIVDPDLVTVTVNRKSFSPERGESVTFTNNVSGELLQGPPAPLWRVHIKRSDTGAAVFVQHGRGELPKNITWNGKDLAGRNLSPGSFTYTLTISRGTDFEVKSEPVTVSVVKENTSSLEGSKDKGTGDEEVSLDYDLIDFDVAEVIRTSEKLVSRVNSYRGIFTFNYTVAEETVITRIEGGTVTEVRVTKREFLTGIEYQADWSRLKEAVALRYGDAEAEPPDADVIFAEEYGLILERGIMDFSSLDEATGLEEYRGGTLLVLSDKGYVWPVEGYFDLSDYFGRYRQIGSIGVDGIHTGIDIPAPVGTNVLAVTSGVIGAVFETAGGGRQLRLDGLDGCSYLYAHLHHWSGSHVGMPVEPGQVIAAVGKTGLRQTGSHLHFEVHVDGVPVDPLAHCGWEVDLSNVR